MAILEDLIKRKPRETSGSASSNRFSFQVDWAFSRLIELHSANKPYLIILDLHEDVVIADSDQNPTRFDFYQVKTKTTGQWTEGDLLSRKKPKKGKQHKKGELLSILGRLYLHRINFPDNKGTLAFVSNARCDLRFDSRFKNDSEILFAKLITAARNRITLQLRDEHGLDKDPICDDCLRFVVTDLHVLKHESNVHGELSILCRDLWPDGSFPVINLYRAIAQQLRARSDFEELPSSVNELLSKKAIGSTEVQTFFDSMAHTPRLTVLWQTAHQALTNEGLAPLKIRQLRQGWNRYGIERQSPTNKSVQDLQKRIREAIRSIEDDDSLGTHMEILDTISQKIGTVRKSLEGNYLRGAILLEFFDEPAGQLPSANKESSGETA